MTQVKNSAPIRLLYALYFVSGFTALIFQVVWMRGMALILGSTIYSMSCVVTVFMLGLALGSLVMSRLLGRRDSIAANAVLIYGAVEVGVGLLGVLVTYTIFAHQTSHLLFIGKLAGNELTARLIMVHFAWSAALLFLPTFLMGTTLPLLSSACAKATTIPKLYGMNTIGAAMGSLAASFLFVPKVGSLGTVSVVAALNLGILIALLLARKLQGAGATTAIQDQGRALSSGSAPTKIATSQLLATMAAATYSGFVILSLELVWQRVFTIFLGDRIYVTSITLFVILAALGIGAELTSYFVGRIGSKRLFLITQCIALASFSVGLLMQESNMLLALHKYWPNESGLIFRNVVSIVGFLTFFTVLPTIAIGMIFPMVLAAWPAGIKNHGIWVGAAYGVNTIAGVLGALLGGYVFMNLFGSNSILLVNGLLMSLAIILVVFGQSESPGRMQRVAAVSCVLLFLVSISPNPFQLPATFDQSRVVLSQEDSHGSFTVIMTKPNAQGVLRAFNNSTELVFKYGAPSTQYVQESQAYFPAVFARKLDNVLNIGAGYGITAGAFSRIEEVKHLDAVEIVPKLIQNASLFRTGNFGYYANDRVKIHVTDGRHFLANSPKQYDVISINVSDPYLPGSASLFSRDFYKMLKSKLKSDGIMCQHIFGPDNASLLHGIKSQFRYVKAMPSYDGDDLTVIASDEELVARRVSLLDSLGRDGKPMLKSIGLTPKGFLDKIDKGDLIIDKLAMENPAFVETDAFPVLEYRIVSGSNGKGRVRYLAGSW